LLMSMVQRGHGFRDDLANRDELDSRLKCAPAVFC
jgi:hypothetical protein